MSAPSTILAETVPSSSASTLPAESVLSTLAADVLDQVMSEGASSSSKMGSEAFKRRSSAFRVHAGHSPSDVVLLLNDSEVRQSASVGRSVGQRGVSCRRERLGLWSRDSLRALCLDGKTVTCSSSGAIRELMSSESRLFDLLAAARGRNGGL